MISEIGKRLKALRETKGIAERTLADLSGVSRETLRRAEAGGNVSTVKLDAIAVALGTSLRRLAALDTPLPGEPVTQASLDAAVRQIISAFEAMLDARLLPANPNSNSIANGFRHRPPAPPETREADSSPAAGASAEQAPQQQQQDEIRRSPQQRKAIP